MWLLACMHCQLWSMENQDPNQPLDNISCWQTTSIAGAINQNKYFEVVFLIESGSVGINQPNARGWTPLLCCFFGSFYHCLVLIATRCRTRYKRSMGKRLLDLAKEVGSEVMIFLLEHPQFPKQMVRRLCLSVKRISYSSRQKTPGLFLKRAIA